MNWMSKLEKRFPHFGIPNLTSYMIVCYVIGYLIQSFSPELQAYLSLNVTKVLQGQIWRLVTWLLTPPSGGNILLFGLVIVLFYYPVGNALERTIGTFRYTCYVFGGILLTILGAFLLYFVTGGLYEFYVQYIFTTYYISTTVLLAFAAIYPDHEILLWFIIPIKMKWMGIVYLAMIVYDMLRYIRGGAWFLAVPIAAALLNFGIFFLQTRNLQRYTPHEVKRRREFRQAMEPKSRAQDGTVITKHKCAVCGRTELDDPNLEFRFCSRCSGNYEYCQDHLFTHTHVQ